MLTIYFKHFKEQNILLSSIYIALALSSIVMSDIMHQTVPNKNKSTFKDFSGRTSYIFAFTKPKLKKKKLFKEKFFLTSVRRNSN